jgi:hypothetical protein
VVVHPQVAAAVVAAVAVTMAVADLTPLLCKYVSKPTVKFPNKLGALNCWTRVRCSSGYGTV